MGKFNDLTGQRFGMLTVIERAENKSGRTAWKCKCDCGNISIALASNLVRGFTKSCGCNVYKDKNKRHGKAKTRIYAIWKAMHFRCNNPNFAYFKDYGGRGIVVCDEWNSFENFYEWAMAKGYTDKLTIDRINVNGNYEPSNCRWANYNTQARNRRNTIYIEHKGTKMSIADWCDLLDKPYKTIIARYETQKKKGNDISFDSIFY